MKSAINQNLGEEKMIIRKYQLSDCKELTELFYNTVHNVNAKDYTKEQLNVWATGQVDLEKWNESLQEHFSVVAVDDEIIVGFGDIDKTGYLDRLFVHADYQRKGIATAICKHDIIIGQAFRLLQKTFQHTATGTEPVRPFLSGKLL